MGVVYRARHVRLQKDVAIKLLRSPAPEDTRARQDFLREAQALSRLDHPNIASIHDFQTVDDIDFLVMEFVPGESLDARLRRGPLAEAEWRALALQLADGLSSAHRKGIVHRDLKPGNIRITPDGRVKILDFGLARLLEPERDGLEHSGTLSRGIVGTLAYMAPEVLVGLPADKRTDVYATGTVLHEAATGEHPFSGGAWPERARRIREEPSRAPQTIGANWSAIVHRCLEKDPARRYPSACELHAALEQAGNPAAGRSVVQRVSAALTPLALLAAAAVVLWLGLRPRHTSAHIRSLAVLPLVNLSHDPGQEYFADGMTEALIGQLTPLDSSYTSVMQWKGSHESARNIARKLRVDALIEGTITRAGPAMQVTVNLVEGESETTKWSKAYKGDTTDVLALQSRVASAIAHEVGGLLSPEDQTRLKSSVHVDPAAYRDYLRGRFHWNQRDESGIRRSIEDFTRAVQRDSSYALAYAGLADAWAAAGNYGLVPPLEAREAARRAAEHAVAMAPDLAEAHTALGQVLQNFYWQWDEAEQEYRRAIGLSPNHSVALHYYSHLLAYQGRFAEARENLRRAQESDPLSMPISLASAGHDYFARDYPAALADCARSAELDSTYYLLYRIRAGILLQLGEPAAAVTSLARSFELNHQAPLAVALRRAYTAGGVRGALTLLVTGLERKRAAGAYEPAEHLAEIYALLGRPEDAFRWLDVALREHDTELIRLGVDPIFDPLRSDPRFEALLHRVGLSSKARPEGSGAAPTSSVPLAPRALTRTTLALR